MPVPLPLAPDVIVIHVALLVAVQPQPAPLFTVTVAVVASDEARLASSGESVNAQGAPAWVIVNVLPAIRSVPVREALPVFAATV